MRSLFNVVSVSVMTVLLAGCEMPAGPNQTGGALLGGTSGAIAGGVIGHNSGGHTAEGAMIGGVIGALAGALVGKDIDESTRAHVVQGRPLTIQDVKSLSKANVGDDLIISQINSTRTVYYLGSTEIIDLKNSGVNEKIIDYMIRTPITFANAQPVPAQGYYYTAPAPYYYYGPPYWYPYPSFWFGGYWGGDHGHHHH